MSPDEMDAFAAELDTQVDEAYELGCDRLAVNLEAQRDQLQEAAAQARFDEQMAAVDAARTAPVYRPWHVVASGY